MSTFIIKNLKGTKFNVLGELNEITKNTESILSEINNKAIKTLKVYSYLELAIMIKDNKFYLAKTKERLESEGDTLFWIFAKHQKDTLASKELFAIEE